MLPYVYSLFPNNTPKEEPNKINTQPQLWIYSVCECTIMRADTQTHTRRLCLCMVFTARANSKSDKSHISEPLFSPI